MRRSRLLYLSDLQLAAEDIFSFTAGKSFNDYLNQAILRAAVERKFILIGEVIAQMRQVYPEISDRITHARQIVDFRNLLIHQYTVVDDKAVWGVIAGALAAFKAELDEWVAELQS